jgi:hypothetical protein
MKPKKPKRPKRPDKPKKLKKLNCPMSRADPKTNSEDDKDNITLSEQRVSGRGGLSGG